jgi:hypothetical protein
MTYQGEMSELNEFVPTGVDPHRINTLGRSIHSTHSTHSRTPLYQREYLVQIVEPNAIASLQPWRVRHALSATNAPTSYTFPNGSNTSWRERNGKVQGLQGVHSDLWHAHVRTSPYYPQSNGKIERWHKSLKGECIRPGTPLSLEDARHLVEGYVPHYNDVRLNSAVGYITPKDMLAER